MIARNLINKGLTEVSIEQDAEIYIINTCSVTEKADKKAEHFIRKLNRRSPESKIIVTGCYAQLKPEKINKLPGVSKVVNAKNKFNINKYIDDNLNYQDDDIKTVKDFNISYSINERTRAFIKIQDGCDYICSYCTIPKARGESRSGTINSIIENINTVVSQGVNEIILSGINVGDFGKNTEEDLLQLLVEIEKIENLNRYRISSIEPNLLNDSIIKLISKSNKAVPHLHIPLQSGNNKILKSMKRRYTTDDYDKLIKKVNKYIPGICIGVDVIVGYPGENHEDFIKTYNYLNKLTISYLHVFSYSDRENTHSINLQSKVSNDQKSYRRKLLQKLSKEKFHNYINNNLNEIKKVLFENYNDGVVDGLTDNYIRVYVNGERELINQIKDVKILKNKDCVYGELIG
tara:strand:- start:69 stop:1280 length:1212 start_codon:yes stop_codon:yes gene_type:complete